MCSWPASDVDDCNLSTKDLILVVIDVSRIGFLKNNLDCFMFEAKSKDYVTEQGIAFICNYRKNGYTCFCQFSHGHSDVIYL